MENISFTINALIQVAIFSLIPLIWWVISGRKQCGFFSWIGLKRPRIQNQRVFVLMIIGLLVAFGASVFMSGLLVDRSAMATSQFYGLGIAALYKALIYGFLQTGLSEEILFRGFLGKRLIARFGFTAGNMTQGLLFGMLHGVMFFTAAGIMGAIIITIMTGAIGWALGYINEKLAGGSIVPSWLIHGVSNVVASILSMFMIA